MPTREEKRPELSKAGGHSATPGVVTAEGVRMCVCVWSNSASLWKVAALIRTDAKLVSTS